MPLINYTILSLMLFACSNSDLSKQKANSNPLPSEKQFWNWFEKNEARIYDFEKDMIPVFNELSYELKKVNSDLVFEFGTKGVDGKRDFVISADGIKTAFQSVRKVYHSAPKMEKWHWVKFRQRKQGLSEFSIGDQTIKPNEIHVVMARDKKKVGLILFFKGYSEEKGNVYSNAGLVLLDQILGEYDLETKISFILYENRDSKYFGNSFPISELAKRFDNYYSGNE